MPETKSAAVTNGGAPGSGAPPRPRPGLGWSLGLGREWAAGLALAVSLGAGTWPGSLEAAESTVPAAPVDFTELSLEQLLKQEITPINVLGSHTHLAGEFMFGYRYTFQKFEGNLDGTREVSADEVLQDFHLNHTFMDMHMQMYDVMYAPSDHWTVMAMGHYMSMDMGHVDVHGESFISRSSGVGDTQLLAFYNVLGDPRGSGHRLILKGGLSLPTGSIDERSAKGPLEYMMQLGSGTYDFLPGLTYIGGSSRWSWGGQAAATVRTGKNSREYRLGNRYQLGSWAHYKVTDWLSPSVRVDWKEWGNVNGADPELDPMTNPAFDATRQRGRRLDLLAGLNFYVPEGRWKGLRFGVEGGVPVYQELAGPNLKSSWMLSLSLSYVLR
jgi:hypothetical protein